MSVYIGGMEHADKHLIYARFISHYLHSKGLVNCPEPFDTLITQGLVRGMTYFHVPSKKYLTPDEAKRIDPIELKITVEKMSKSKLNGLSPLDVVERFGKDAVKMFVLGDVPVEKDLDFLENGIDSIKRKLDKWQLFFDNLASNFQVDEKSHKFVRIHEKVLDKETQTTASSKKSGSREEIREILLEYKSGFNYRRAAFHVSLARLNEFFAWIQARQTNQELNVTDLKLFFTLLYPFAPFFA